jgi:glucose/arabinose dehydrogenase
MKLIALILVAACADSQANPASKPASNAVPDSAAVAAVTATSLRLEQVGDRFRNPVFLTAPSGDSRLFIVEQAGRIRIVKDGRVLPIPFLNISDRVRSGGEQGLLSMAFHPDYRSNGEFFVNFTDRSGDTRIERFKVSSNPDLADESSMKLIVEIDQPYSNHNGGLVMFGLDGMLYVGMGDGGSGGDPHGNGQNRNVLLGKILRIDVSRDARPEIWAIGMRNPWRFAFDRPTGLLYIADVGQNQYEEINVEPANRAGLNYGWNIMEGDHCYRSDNCSRDGLVLPRVTFNHSGGACSVTGGFVYRGRSIPSIAGHYFYSDYCAGWIKSFRFVNGRVTDQRTWNVDDLGHVVSFGEDSSGELYILTESGRVLRIAGVS